MTAATLIADRITVAFGGLVALSDVSLEVARGAIVGLIGPNGAGKTTLVNVLTGFQAPRPGSVRLGGDRLDGLKPHQIRRRGVSRSFQAGRLFRDLSVLDNIAVPGVGAGLARAAAEAEAMELLAWMGIERLGGVPAAILPYTDQRRVAIARALMCRPSFLLLDEPAAGMSESECEDISRLIERIAGERGCGILLIEHNIAVVLGTCATIHVLESGRLIESGPPQAIRDSAAVREAYLGGVLDEAPPEQQDLLLGLHP